MEHHRSISRWNTGRRVTGLNNGIEWRSIERVFKGHHTKLVYVRERSITEQSFACFIVVETIFDCERLQSTAKRKSHMRISV